MAKCPECHADIDHLQAQEEKAEKFFISEAGDPTYEPRCPFGERFDRTFFCPVCLVVVADDQDEAEAILKERG